MMKIGFFNNHKTKNNQRGQGLLEFALVLPLLILFLVGLADIGRAFFAIITLENAAREGVRYGTLYPKDMAAAKLAAVNEANGSGISLNTSNVTMACTDKNADGRCDAKTPITATVSYDFELILGWIWPKKVTLTRDAVMVVP